VIKKLKKIIAVVGANISGLEMIAMIQKDPNSEIAMLVDPNPNALGFNLDKYGYRFADSIAFSLVQNLAELKNIEGLNIIINSSDDPHMHRKLYRLNISQAQIMRKSSAALIWGIKTSSRPATDTILSEELSKKQIFAFQQFANTASNIDLSTYYNEFYELFLTVAMEATEADTGSVMLVDDQKINLILVASKGLDEAISKSLKMRFPRIGEGIAGRVAQIGEPLLLSGNFDDLRFRNLRDEEGVKSAISIPIKSQVQLLGVLNVGHKKSYEAFDRKDLAFLSKLINLASKYFVEVNTLERLKISQLEQSILEVSNEISASKIPLDDKIQKIINKIAKKIDIDACTLYLRDPYSGELSLQASTDISPHFFGVLKLKNVSGAMAKALKQKRAILLKEHPEYFFDDESIEEIESYQFIIPLISDEEVLGLIIFLFSGSLAKSNKLLSICRNIAQILSRTVKSELERDRKSLQDIRMTSANEAGMSLISILDKEKLGFTICASSCQLVDGEFSLMRLYDASKNSLLVYSSYNNQQSPLDKPAQRLDAQIALDTYGAGKPQLLTRLEKTKYAEANLVPENIKSAISFPLIHENSILGTLTIYNKLEKSSFSSSYFNKDDEEAIERIAFYSAMSLKNAQDFDQRKSLFTINEITGLYNLKSFEYRLMEEISRANRYKESFSILMIKIDNLIDIKANFGISKISVLKVVAAVLEEHFRKSDIIFHVEDDKFAILLIKSAAEAGAADGIARFKSFIARKDIKVRGMSAPLKLAFGISSYPEDASSKEQLLKKASFYKDSVCFGEQLPHIKSISEKESDLDDFLALR
jgi:diguanylate cyclase (GGDEF)-like protein